MNPTETLSTLDAMKLADHKRSKRDRLNSRMPSRRHMAAQIFTPLEVAQDAAQTLDLLPNGRQGRPDLHIVDAGTGHGQLTLAVLAELGKLPKTDRPNKIRVTAIEEDPVLARAAEANLQAVTRWCEQQEMTLEVSVINDDFTKPERWHHHPNHGNGAVPIDICITNPPYRRLGADAPETKIATKARLSLTGNEYTVFCEKALRLLRRQGQLVAITPRSFQNGPSRPLVLITHGNRERGTSWVWTTVGERKWSRERPRSEHRLETHADQNDDMIDRWSDRLTTLASLGLTAE